MSNKLRICMVTDDPFLLGGGPEHIRQVSEILRTKYHYFVDVVTPKTMNSDFIFSDFWQRIKYVFWVTGFILTSDYDIYHSQSFSTSLFLPVAKFRGKKIGVTVHGTGVNLVGGGVLNDTSLPKLLCQLILNHWPLDFRLSANSITGFIKIGNGVDVAEFAKIKRHANKIFTILCISRRDPVKGIGILEHAVERIPNCKLNLVSGRRRTIADFAGADCYILPSLSEGLPIVLLEAMAAKLPIIATDVGDCRSLVESADCGYIINPGSVEDLVKAIKKMMEDKNRKLMGENGYNYVRKYYTWEKISAKLYAVYLGVLKKE